MIMDITSKREKKKKKIHISQRLKTSLQFFDHHCILSLHGTKVVSSF